MTNSEFRDFCMIEFVKTFLGKLPSIGIPANPMNTYERQNFIQQLARDSREMAEAMIQERNNHPIY